jgi:hypothetical protein
MRWAWMRALKSTPPPAANGTTNVIGRVGQSCAVAEVARAISAVEAAIVNLCMVLSCAALTFALIAGGIKGG